MICKSSTNEWLTLYKISSTESTTKVRPLQSDTMLGVLDPISGIAMLVSFDVVSLVDVQYKAVVVGTSVVVLFGHCCVLQ